MTIRDLIERDKKDIIGLYACEKYTILLDIKRGKKKILNNYSNVVVEIGNFEKDTHIETLLVDSMGYVLDNFMVIGI